VPRDQLARFRADDVDAEHEVGLPVRDEDIAATIHAHPTLPEAVMEAAEAVHGLAIHAIAK